MTTWLNLSTEFWVIVFGTFLVHQLAWFAFNIPYLIIDDYELFKQHRLHQKDKRTPTSKERWDTFRVIARDHFLQMLPLQMLSYPLLKAVGFYFSKQPPVLTTFAVQFLVFNVIEDTLFYWVHRALHTPWAFRNIHKKHHLYTQPFSLTGEVAHPAEFLLNFLIPLMAGPFLMGMLQGVHIYTFWAWIVFRELRGVDAHSGYNLPYHPLRLLNFCYGGPKAHGFHHMSKGFKANFGGYKFWDWLMGTDRAFVKWQSEGGYSSVKD